ncbi:PREDICTED: uncharacterized protein LOC106807140 [Priapulus caudatus]|uniref:Uncharacterized protein LOC106807140 n=1 Tax=Priapulus caudatus TaxID=37621 RepID=A0ABM1DY68_PRICU|nr:PREDICTED: uncharacterized protein LOC106807140 [Priapulus caudatus]
MEICEYLYYKQATGWTKMYCALRDGSCTVWRTSDTGQPPLVFLDLRGCAATLADDEQQVGSAFRLTLPNRYTFLFAPPSNLDMERWLSVLRHNGCEITDDDDATTTTATVTLRRATTVTQSAFYAEMTGGGDAAESATVEAFCTAPRRRRAPRDAAATQTLTQPWFNGDVRPRTGSDASDDGPPAERSALCTVPEVRIRKMSAASSTSCESAPPTLLVERSRIGETSDRLHPRLALRSTSCSPPRERKSHLVQHSRSMDHFDDDSVAAAVAAEEEEEHERWGRELLLLKRDQLLQEVLRQKAELEARQQHKPQVTEADINIKYERAQTEEDLKILRDITQLRQRRISTVLRVESLQKSLKKSSKKIGGSGGSGKGRLVTMGSSEELKTRLVEMTDEVTRINDEIATREHRREVAQHKLSTQRVEELQRFSASMKRRDAPSRPSGGAAGNRCDTPSPPVATGGVAAAVTTVAPPRGASPKPAERAKKGAKYGPLKIVTNIAEFRLRSSDSKKKNKQQRKHEVAQRALDVISGSTTSLDAVDAGPKASPDSADARLSSPELVAPPVDAKACESARGVSSFETEVMAMLQRTKTSSVSSRDGSTSSGHSRRLTADEALLKPETIAVITEFESYIDDYLKQTDSVENVAL